MLLKILTGAYVAVTASALVIVKLSSRNGSFIELVNGKLHLNINLLTITGIFLYGASFLMYIYLISKFDLGYIIPLTTALIYILIFVASFTIFKETFTTMKIAGILLIVIGLIFLNWKK